MVMPCFHRNKGAVTYFFSFSTSGVNIKQVMEITVQTRNYKMPIIIKYTVNIHPSANPKQPQGELTVCQLISVWAENSQSGNQPRRSCKLNSPNCCCCPFSSSPSYYKIINLETILSISGGRYEF